MAAKFRHYLDHRTNNRKYKNVKHSFHNQTNNLQTLGSGCKCFLREAIAGEEFVRAEPAQASEWQRNKGLPPRFAKAPVKSLAY